MKKLIVLEGIDGSGKSTQFKKICSRLEQNGIEYYHTVFPRYEKDSSALIRMYLNGEFGSNPSDVNAYTASMFFAVDRFASYKDDWGKIYESGKMILSDRYTSSNAVHQGAKLSDDELPSYFEWLADLEYNKMCLPRPDIVIYLDSTLELSLSRMKKRQQETNTNADIHEKDVEYLARCLHTADLACDYFGWKRISYEINGTERSVDEKAEEIYSLIWQTEKQ